jgi:hypothetical protein
MLAVLKLAYFGVLTLANEFWAFLNWLDLSAFKIGPIILRPQCKFLVPFHFWDTKDTFLTKFSF